MLEILAKLIYWKRHVFSCQMVDKSAMIICVRGAKALPSGRVKFDCQNFEFSLASRTSFCHACGQVVASGIPQWHLTKVHPLSNRDKNKQNLQKQVKITSYWRLELCGLDVTISARYDWSVARQSTSFALGHQYSGILPYKRNCTLQTHLSITKEFFHLQSTFTRL